MPSFQSSSAGKSEVMHKTPGASQMLASLFPSCFTLLEGFFSSLLFCLAGTSFITSSHRPQIVPGLRLKDPSVCTERLSCPSYKGEMYSKWGTSKVNVGDKCLYLESASALILVSIF